MDATTAAYLAGLMDGEGCLYVERFATYRSCAGYQYRIIATVTMTDLRTIEFVCSVTGKNYRKRKLKSGRTAYTIDWRNSVAYNFISTIRPYLHGKREQADWCLFFDDVLCPGRGLRHVEELEDHRIYVREHLQFLKTKESDIRC